MIEVAKNTMGGRIREQRNKLGITQEKLAEYLCTTKPLISQYENNKVDIKASIIVELSRILNTNAGYLLNGEVTSSDMDNNMIDMIKLFHGINSDNIKKVALEQLKSLSYLK